MCCGLCIPFSRTKAAFTGSDKSCWKRVCIFRRKKKSYTLEMFPYGIWRIVKLFLLWRKVSIIPQMKQGGTWGRATKRLPAIAPLYLSISSHGGLCKPYWEIKRAVRSAGLRRQSRQCDYGCGLFVIISCPLHHHTATWITYKLLTTGPQPFLFVPFISMQVIFLFYIDVLVKW